jgi:hypothetical protein
MRRLLPVESFALRRRAFLLHRLRVLLLHPAQVPFALNLGQIRSMFFHPVAGGPTAEVGD